MSTLFRSRSGVWLQEPLSLHPAIQQRWFALSFPPQLCSVLVEHPLMIWKHPYAKHRGAYPQLRCVCPKRWCRLQCSGPFVATYDSTDTRKPHISFSDRTLQTYCPTTDAMKIGVGRLSFVGSLLKRPDRRCVNRRTPMFRDSIFSRMALSGIPLFRFFTRSHTQRSSGSEKVWKQTPSFPSKGRQCSDANSDPVSG